MLRETVNDYRQTIDTGIQSLNSILKIIADKCDKN